MTESETLKINEKTKLNRILSGSEGDGGWGWGLEGGETTHPEGEGPFQKGDRQCFGGRLPELLPVHSGRMGQNQASPEDLFSNQFQGNLE